MADARYQLEEFQESSKELEDELEKEVESTERRYNEIRIRNDAMRQEVEEWKVNRLPYSPNNRTKQTSSPKQNICVQ